MISGLAELLRILRNTDKIWLIASIFTAEVLKQQKTKAVTKNEKHEKMHKFARLRLTGF